MFSFQSFLQKYEISAKKITKNMAHDLESTNIRNWPWKWQVTAFNIKSTPNKALWLHPENKYDLKSAGNGSFKDINKEKTFFEKKNK